MTPADVINQAIEYAGNQASVTYSGGVWDGDRISAYAASVLYVPTWQMVARQVDPDFARRTAPLAAVTAGTLPPGWAHEYAYPSDCLRLRCLAPQPGSYDPFDPQLILGNVALDPTAAPAKVIFTNQADALAVYTSSDVTEDEWDALFEQAVVRQLANPLTMAVQGRPDFAREMLITAQQYEQQAELVDESAARGG